MSDCMRYFYVHDGITDATIGSTSRELGEEVGLPDRESMYKKLTIEHLRGL